MKRNWEVKKLGDVCDFVRGPFGGSLKKQMFVDDGYAVYEQSHAIYNQFSNIRYYINEDKFNEMKRFEINPGNLIMSCSGTMGKVAIVPEGIKKGIINQALLLLTPKKNIQNSFIKFWMESESFQESLKAYSLGAAIQNVASVKVLKEIKILIPELLEQQRIVGILEEAFRSIELAKEKAEKNLRNAQEIFESYLQSVFANPGDEWEEKKLGDNNLIEIIDGDRGKNYPTKSEFFEKGFCLFMNTKNVRPDGLNFETVMFISEDKDKALGKGKLKRNDVVMTTRGTIGNLGVYSNDVPYDNIRINSGMLIFRPNLKFIIPEYLFEVLRSGIIKAQIKKHVSGAAQPQLPIKTLVNFTFPVPKSITEQRSIVHKLNDLSIETKKLEDIYNQKLNNLEELKKSILQKAFNGEL